MKSLDPTNFLLSTRSIGARLTFTDYRLRFAALADTDVPSDYTHYDASEYDTGIIQVRTKAGDPATTIYWRYISDLNGAWPAWTTVTLGAATTDVALFNDTLFVSGKIYTSIFNLAVFTTVPAYANELIAPVSATEFYAFSNVSGICHLYNVKNGTAVEFIGAIYEEVQPVFFDAARVGNKDYIYFVKDGGMKTYFLTHQLNGTYHNWGAITPLVPMDVVDDISQVRLSSVNIVNGKPMVAAVLMRSSGLGMHIYTIGTDSYTLGRDLFVGTANLTGRAKFFLIGDKVWFIGPGVKYSAPATQFVGYSNAAKEFSTSETISINMPMTLNDSPTAQIILRNGITHAAIRPGAKCKLEVASNGVYVQLGTFGVDAITDASGDSGKDTTITLRALGTKELTNWNSDAPYDYWSQTKVNCNPKDMTEVVRTSALWAQEANGLTTYDLNTKGFLYVAERSCTNGIIEGKFIRSSSDAYSRFGVGLHYTVETPLDTATRLNIQEGDVTNDLLGHSGLFAIEGMDEDMGEEGVGVYVVNNNVWTQIAHRGVFFGKTAHWLRMQYIDGYIIVHYRSDTNPTWVKVLSVVNATVPYSSEFSSRGAIFMENATGGSICPLLDGATKCIPVLDNSSFPNEDTLKIGDEFIHYRTKSLNIRETVTELWKLVAEADEGIPDGVNTSVPIGQNNLSTAVRIPLVESFTYQYGTSYFIPVAKIGNPTDLLWIGAYNGDNTLRTSLTVKPDLIETAATDGSEFPELLVFTVPHAIKGKDLTLGEFDAGYIVIRRLVQTTYDADNYYVVQVKSGTPVVYPPPPTLSNVRYWVRKYNTSTSTWETPVAGKSCACRSYFCQDPNLPLTVSAPVSPGIIKYFLGSYNKIPWVPTTGCAAILPNGEIRQVVSDLDVLDPDTNDMRIITYDGAYGPHLTTATAGTSDIEPTVHQHSNEIYPALLNSQRGYKGTTVTSHTIEKIDVYRTGPFAYVDELHYWTGDMDLSLDDLIREISTKSGYPYNTSKLLYPASVTPSASNPVIKSRNFIVKFSLAAAPAGTIVVEGRRDLAAARVKIELSNTSIKYYSGATLVQQYDLPFTGLFGDVVVSLYEEHVSVWRNGTLLHSFVLSTADAAYTGEYMALSGTENSAVSVYMPEGCNRVDNYILDNNKTGISLIDMLIGNKKFWFFDSNDTIKIVQSAIEVNTSSTAYQLAVLNNHSTSEMGAITRLRVEGAEVAEVIDEAMMAEWGNLFSYINIPEINSQGDADYYAAINMAEAGSRYEVYSLQGAADPRIEPYDVIYVNLPEGVRKVLVDEISFMVDIQSEGGPLFDMMINGRVLRSDL